MNYIDIKENLYYLLYLFFKALFNLFIILIEIYF